MGEDQGGNNHGKKLKKDVADPFAVFGEVIGPALVDLACTREVVKRQADARTENHRDKDLVMKFQSHRKSFRNVAQEGE